MKKNNSQYYRDGNSDVFGGFLIFLSIAGLAIAFVALQDVFA